MPKVVINEKALRESILKIVLCENEIELPSSLPVSASQHSSTQLSTDSPNVEDVKFVPTSQEVLGLALQKWATVVPVDKIPEFYQNFLKFLDTQIQEEEQ
jgi:hypothetical protein